MLVSMRQLLDHAGDHNYGIPAFNINNMEQMLSVLNAASKTDSPVIIAASSGARKYATDDILLAMVKAACQLYYKIPIAFHLDHGSSPHSCFTAIKAGFSSVMMDGSLKDGKPSSYEYNVNVTKQVVDVAHQVGITVEGELGVLGSLETGKGEKEDGHGFDGSVDKKKLLTDPDQAVDYAKQTNIDALAIAIGTSHGAYKFTRKPTGDILAIYRIAEIHQKLPNTHLVLHGSSTVPKYLQDMINQFGGDIPETFGVPVEEIVKGIKTGVRKVNIDTDCRMAMTAHFRKVAQEKRKEFDVRKFMIPAMEEMTKLCIKRFEAFGTAGHANKIKPMSLSKMMNKYISGELNTKFG